jgi:hypothetical protein
LPLVFTEAVAGLTETLVTVADAAVAVTLTVATADLVGSATLVAVTVSVPAFAGAVYWPADEIVPSRAFHVTFVFVVVPCTAAWNGSVPLVTEAADDGVMTTAVTAPLLLVPLNGEVLPTFVPATATVALAEKVGSATLCAVTRPTPPAIGAVNTPAWVIVPIVVDHVTAWLEVAPWSRAANLIVPPGAGVETSGETWTVLTIGVVVDPAPLSGNDVGRCPASVTMLTVPDTLPVSVGANTMLKLADLFVARVIGVVAPERAKPLPLTTTWLTVTGLVPVLITETGTVFDDPTFVLTDSVDGATESVGSGSAIPAHPATQATTTARRLESTRTRFSLNTFMSIRSPYCKFKFLLSIHRFCSTW